MLLFAFTGTAESEVLRFGGPPFGIGINGRRALTDAALFHLSFDIPLWPAIASELALKDTVVFFGGYVHAHVLSYSLERICSWEVVDADSFLIDQFRVAIREKAQAQVLEYTDLVAWSLSNFVV